MSEYFRFIATRTTYATTIPSGITDVKELAYRLRGALRATDYPLRVGELRDFPLSTAQANMLLCDGSELPKLSFPELAAWLTQNPVYQAANPDNFLLPDFVGVATPAPVYPPQEVTGSDVNTGGTPTEPTQPGEVGGTTGYNPPSGGRPQYNVDEV